MNYETLHLLLLSFVPLLLQLRESLLCCDLVLGFFGWFICWVSNRLGLSSRLQRGYLRAMRLLVEVPARFRWLPFLSYLLLRVLGVLPKIVDDDVLINDLRICLLLSGIICKRRLSALLSILIRYLTVLAICLVVIDRFETLLAATPVPTYL